MFCFLSDSPSFDIVKVDEVSSLVSLKIIFLIDLDRHVEMSLVSLLTSLLLQASDRKKRGGEGGGRRRTGREGKRGEQRKICNGREGRERHKERRRDSEEECLTLDLTTLTFLHQTFSQAPEKCPPPSHLVKPHLVDHNIHVKTTR